MRYRVLGPLREVVFCHCTVCQRTHGRSAAYTACDHAHLELTATEGLRWHEHDGARRAFCGNCGGRLFWERPDRPTISIAAGTIDPTCALVPGRHIHRESAGAYESL